jgi:hypothetical protein
MNANQKLEALKAGELDKIVPLYCVLEEGKFLYKRQNTDNAAKVETTKAVLAEALIELGVLTEHWNGDYVAGMEAIERVQGLLIELEEAL